jgi:hypothetical protein
MRKTEIRKTSHNGVKKFSSSLRSDPGFSHGKKMNIMIVCGGVISTPFFPLCEGFLVPIWRMESFFRSLWLSRP